MNQKSMALAVIPVLFLAAPAMSQDVISGMAPIVADLSSMANGGTAESGEMSGRIIQLFGLITLLSVAPGLLIVMTSFTRFVIVFSMLRSALGTGQSPPNMVITSLALFMTFFVMNPVFTDAWENGLSPLVEGSITEEQAVPLIADPFHRFMVANTREADLALFQKMANRGNDASRTGTEQATDGEGGEGGDDLRSAADQADAILPSDLSEVPWSTLVPAFIISELRRAFTIGFLIYLPFIAIDLIVASILMGAGMMMLSPVMISLPFKIIFFVLIDGWYMLAGSLMQSYVGV